MARVNPNTQIPTDNQAAILLLASQKKGTNQGEMVRFSGKDSMSCFCHLRSMCGGKFRRKKRIRTRRGDYVEDPKGTVLYGRGWLRRRVLKYREMSKRNKSGKPKHLWRYDITESGRLALRRWFLRKFGDDGVNSSERFENMIANIAEPLQGWFTICGWDVEPRARAAMALWADHGWSDGRFSVGWASVKRGRDLRFPGWGPCDTSRILDFTDKSLPRLPIPVGTAQLIAYGAPTYCGMWYFRLQDHPELLQARQWLAQWRDWWLGMTEGGGSRLSRLDEVFGAIRLGIPLVGHPETVFARLAERVEEEEAEVERLAELEDAERELIPFAAQPVTIDSGQWKLSAVTTPQELREVGKQLKNCVGGYSDFCREPNRLIAVLTDDKGKMLACGEWLGNGWGQIAGPCNKEPTAVVIRHFKAHGKELAVAALPWPEPKRLEGEVDNDQA